MLQFSYVVFYSNGDIIGQTDDDWTAMMTREQHVSNKAKITFNSRPNEPVTSINAVVMSYFLNQSITFSPGRKRIVSFAQSGNISYGITIFYLRNPPKDVDIKLKCLFFPGDNFDQCTDGWSMKSINNTYYIRKNVQTDDTIQKDQFIFILYPSGPMSMKVKWKLIQPNQLFNITPKNISSEFRYLQVIYMII